MIEMKIPKEISRYEAKAIGPFTLRQLICLLIFIPIGGGLYFITSPYVGTSTAGFFVLPFGLAAWAFGWYKPYGLKFEKYLKTVFINSFVAPTKRPYKTENFYGNILKEIERQEAQENGQSSTRKGKAKYKRSREAYM